MKFIIKILIRFYQQAISVHFPPACKYYPTCSSYAYEAVEKYGVFRGIFMSVMRLFRCHPFHAGGYDPVP
jgi:putative membrane protein insertion efficiency factor